MKNGTLSGIVVDSDLDYALGEILHYSYTIEVDGADPIALACALLETAKSVMDYEDPWDYEAHGDKSWLRRMRLINFCDSIVDFTDKRLALLKGHDTYMTRRLREYVEIKSAVRIIHNIAEDDTLIVDYEDIVGLLQELKDELLIQGVSRPVLARAFADCAFVYAKLQPMDDFIRFCHDIKQALGGSEETSSGPGYMAEIVTQREHVQASGLIH